MISPDFSGIEKKIIDVTPEQIATRIIFIFLTAGVIRATKLNGTAKSKDQDLGAIFPKIKPNIVEECQKIIMQIEAPIKNFIVSVELVNLC